VPVFCKKGNAEKAGAGGGKKSGKVESDFDISKVEALFQPSVANLQKQFETLHAARATPTLLEKLVVELPGGKKSAVSALGQVAIKDAQQMWITLYDEQMAKAVEKAVRTSEFQLAPTIEGTVVKVALPKVTKEYRDNLVKMATKFTEQAKLAVKQARQNAMSLLKKSELPEDEEKTQEKEIQVIVDRLTKQLTTMSNVKTKELTTV